MRDSTRPLANDEARFDWTGLLLLVLWAMMTVAGFAYLAEVRFL